MRRIPFFVLLAAPLLCLPACAQQTNSTISQATSWAPVPPMDWTGIKPTDFSDNELDIPYLLEHFHTLANSVVEKGENRGFLDIKVAREPKDNQPYNARIMEGILAFSYFYGVKKPWNPYYNSPAVRARLEAMLEYWCSIQGPNGLFSEYKAGDYTLAPTGFGARAMSQTLEILQSGGPTVDAAILQRTMSAQRKAIMALLTLDYSLKWGREYSNQFSGVYQSALSYLKLRPDAEMKTALDQAVRRAVAEHQSPAGFMYEWGGADFGYSNVHENNLRLAWPYLKDAPTVREPLLEEFDEWHRWLSYNLLVQPEVPGYLTNAGVNSRTSHSLQEGTSRPMAEVVPSARPFSLTGEEWKTQIADKRAKLAENWPKFKPLVVPSAYSYNYGGFQIAYRDVDTWFPTSTQKAVEIAKLPYLASDNFTRVATDSFPYSFTFVRRPSYYAIFNAGKIRRGPEFTQSYGMGLFWNPNMGTVIQSVANTPWQWGTRLGTADKIAENKSVSAKITVGGKAVSAQPGWKDYAVEPVKMVYALDGGGQKTVQLDADGIIVNVVAQGDLTEQLPLVKYRGDSLKQAPGRLSLRHGDTTLEITFDAQTQVEFEPAAGFVHGLERVLVKLKAQNSLSYRLAFAPPR